MGVWMKESPYKIACHGLLGTFLLSGVDLLVSRKNR